MAFITFLRKVPWPFCLPDQELKISHPFSQVLSFHEALADIALPHFYKKNRQQIFRL